MVRESIAPLEPVNKMEKEEIQIINRLIYFIKPFFLIINRIANGVKRAKENPAILIFADTPIKLLFLPKNSPRLKSSINWRNIEIPSIVYKMNNTLKIKLCLILGVINEKYRKHK